MIGELVSGAFSLAGGLLGKSSADEARRQQALQHQQNIELQKEFATHGITWKVDDARRAGIHPIYALGASTPTYTPSSTNFTADTSLPQALASAGQDIGRAINTTKSKADQVYTATAQRLALEKAGLENDVLRMELASKAGRLRQNPSPGIPVGASVPPSIIPGQGDALFKEKPMEVTPSHPGAPNVEPATFPSISYSREKTGYGVSPSKDWKERNEDNIIQEAMWAWKNNVLPSLMINQSPPPWPAPKGTRWVFNPLKQEYQAQDDALYRYFRRHDPLPVRPSYNHAKRRNR